MGRIGVRDSHSSSMSICAAREVVDDGDLVTEVGQVQGGGPAAETVAAEDEDFHGIASIRLHRLSRVGGIEPPLRSGVPRQ